MMRPRHHRLSIVLAVSLALGLVAASARAEDQPRLVRIILDRAVTLSRVLESGLDVVDVHGLSSESGEVRVLLWPADESRLAALGATAELIDPAPGATLARRTAADLRLHPRPAVPAYATGTATLPPFGSGSMGGYWTGDEIKMKLDQLVASDVHDVVADKIDTLGYTIQGRPVWGLKLGKTVVGPDARPVVFYNAITHAREPEGMQALFYFVDDLLAKYGTDPFATSLLDHRVLYIVPLVNPDGYQINVNTYVSSGGASFGFWRKNARDNDANTIIDGQDGVDINRNYGYQWGLDNIGSSGSFSTETYRGTSAFSEPETRIERDIIDTLKPRTGLSFHTYSDLMLFPWGYTTTAAPDSDAFKEWTDVASLGDGYQTGQSTRVLYAVNGEFNDWTYGDTLLKPRAFTWTPEVGNPNDDFYPPPSRIVPLAAENLRRCYVTAALAGAFVRIERATFAEGALDIGAIAHVSVSARNLGLASAGPGLQAAMVSLDPGVVVFGGTVSYPGLGTRQSADPISGATFTVATADTLTPGRILRMEVDFTDSNGMFSRDTVEIPAGEPTTVYADDAASLAAWKAVGWGISSGDAAHPAPYFADSPLGRYPNSAKDTLQLLSTLDLSSGVHAYARFGSRYDIETGYDAAWVEASLDGSSWTPLSGRATVPGIPATQPVGKPIYEGTRHRWAAERVDLSPFAGPTATSVRLRFRLTSDAGSTFDGFNFDSLRIVVFDPGAQPAPVAVGGGAPAPALDLAPPAPNPASVSTRFAFTLPRSGAVRLEILDLAGRRVRTIASGVLPAERYVRVWDLRDDVGHRVAPGVYLACFAAPDGVRTRRLAVLH